MKIIVIKNPAGDVQVTKKYSMSLENPGTIIKLGNFKSGILNFMKSDYIRSSEPVDVELGISENQAQNVVEKTTTYFLANLFRGARIDLRGKDTLTNFGINGVIGYRYDDNVVYVDGYNLGSVINPKNKLCEVAFAFLPLYDIAWQLKHNKNIELRFINKSKSPFYSEESGIRKLDIGESTLRDNERLYVIVPDEADKTLSLIQKKEFLQMFYDKVDFCEKF